MPKVVLPDGRIKYIPGVYFDTKVRSTLPGPLPEFQIPVILAAAWEGHPYNADTLVQTSEIKPGGFKFFGTADAAGDYYGRGSEMHRAFLWAQRHGLPGAYCCSLSALTRASVIVDTATVEQATIYSRSFGAPGGWTQLRFTGNVLTVRKLKNYSFLKSNLSNTATRIELKGDTDWIVEGGVYSIGDNTVAIGTVEVKRKTIEIDANGQFLTVIETVAAFGSAITTANYAMIGEYDLNNDETFSGITTAQELIDKVNGTPSAQGSKIVGVHKHANFTNGLPDALGTLTPIKQIAVWLSATAGTSPAPSSTQVSALITQLNAGGLDDFMDRFDVIPQAYLLVMGDSASHVAMRDYAIQRRAAGYPISITAGVRWGDHVIDSSTDTDPLFRTNALNSQDFSLWGPGLDREAPYISLAAAVFGRRCAGGPRHNLTNDDLIFSTIERRWDETNLGELSKLLRGGFGTLKKSVGRRIRYRVAQGLSTLQNNEGLIWNKATKDTWSLMQRDLKDFVDRVQGVDLEEDIIGADGVNVGVIAGVLQRRAEVSLIGRGYIEEYFIESIALNEAANGFDVKHDYRLPATVDFVSVESTILIG